MFFFFNDTATTEIYTLSLHDALPISQGESVGHKLLEGIKPQAPLKPRIEEAQKKLHMQIARLDAISSRMQEKDKLIFKRVVLAMQSHDSSHAKVLSGELSQIRKMNKMVTSAK